MATENRHPNVLVPAPSGSPKDLLRAGDTPDVAVDGPDREALIAWVSAVAFRVDTIDPSVPPEDLLPLRPLFEQATVVGLGESVRGVRGGHELYLVKHRLLRLLVDVLDVRAMALEESAAVGARLDDYVCTGTGDPRALLTSAWGPWRSEEFVDVVRWLRARNAACPDDPVRVVGVDGPEHDALARNTLAWRERTGDKIAYWGGMAHTAVTRAAAADAADLGRNDGAVMRDHLGAGYVSVGITCHHGVGPRWLPPPPDDFAESVLGEVGIDQYVLDLRHGASPDAVRAWLDSPGMTRVIGPRYDPDDDRAYAMTGGSLRDWFDILVHISEITPVHYFPS